jgi:hypothetical protein
MAIGYLQIHGEYQAFAGWLHHSPMLILAVGVACIFRKRLLHLAKWVMN